MSLWLSLFLGFKVCAAALLVLHHPWAALVTFLAPDPWVFMQFIRPGSQAFGPAVTHFEHDGPQVWLTIDDGPDPATTPRILDLLGRHGAKATFFFIGERVKRHPDLARLAASKGHTIGLHSDTHPLWSFWCRTPQGIADEIDGNVGALLLANAPFEHYFRPPAGVRSPLLRGQLDSRGMKLVLWSARGFDAGPGSPKAALARVARRIRPGAVVLAHESGGDPDRRVAYVESLLGLIDREGYRCVLPARESLRSGPT